MPAIPMASDESFYVAWEAEIQAAGDPFDA
jgi:hypothetical protein